jgi:hypothetical protein
MMKLAIALAAGTATAMFLSQPVSNQIVKIDFIKKQAAGNQEIYKAAITGGLGAMVAILVAR